MVVGAFGVGVGVAGLGVFHDNLSLHAAWTKMSAGVASAVDAGHPLDALGMRRVSAFYECALAP